MASHLHTAAIPLTAYILMFEVYKLHKVHGRQCFCEILLEYYYKDLAICVAMGFCSHELFQM